MILSTNMAGQMVYREVGEDHDVIRWYEGGAKMEVPTHQFKEELARLRLNEEDPQ